MDFEEKKRTLPMILHGGAIRLCWQVPSSFIVVFRKHYMELFVYNYIIISNV